MSKVPSTKQVRRPNLMKGQLTDYEKADILRLRHEQNKSMEAIAQFIGRDVRTVSTYLRKMADMTPVARAVIKANSVKLAERVVKHADVDQAMDLLSRPGVDVIAPPVNPKSGGGIIIQNSVSVVSLGAVVKEQNNAGSLSQDARQIHPEGNVIEGSKVEGSSYLQLEASECAGDIKLRQPQASKVPA